MATRRGYYRGELLRAIQNLSMCATHLIRVYEAYAPQHPDIAGYLEKLIDGILEMTDLIKSVHDSI